jgi:hypothetical protein
VAPLFRSGERANSEEERHEKERPEQEEEGWTITELERAQDSAESAFRAKSKKEKRPLTRGRFFVLLSATFVRVAKVTARN